jgi:invasion protein IalB
VIEKQRVCEMVQTLAGKDRRIVARTAVGRPPKSESVRAVLQVPAGVDLTVPASITFDDRNAHQGKYVVCAPSFCRSEVVFPDEAAKSFQQIKKASISFRLLGKTIIVPIQLDGMQVAFTAATKPS